MDNEYSPLKDIILDTDVCSAFGTDACIFDKCEPKHCLLPKEMIDRRNTINHNKRHNTQK
jgi:hypothetical protein